MPLGENPADSIAEIGVFLERRDGGYLIGDRFLPRVRTYDEEGRLEAAFGRFGDGPFEFRRITAVAEMPAGESRRCRLQQIPSDLSEQLPDSRYHGGVAGSRKECPGARIRPARAYGPGGPQRRGIRSPSAASPGDAGGVGMERLRTLPFSDFERPYWSSFADYAVATGGDSTYVTSGLRYPITVIDGSGETVGTFGTPSASFRPIPVLEQGALANLGSYGATPREFPPRGFDVIDRIDAVGAHLVLTRSRYNPARLMYPLDVLHTSLEVYDRGTGTKLYEDVPLPDGSRGAGWWTVSVSASGHARPALADREAPVPGPGLRRNPGPCKGAGSPQAANSLPDSWSSIPSYCIAPPVGNFPASSSKM